MKIIVFKMFMDLLGDFCLPNSISSSTAATQGEVANSTDAGDAAVGAAPWIMALIAFATFATMMVSAWICCASSALDGGLPAMVGLGMHDGF